MLLGKAGLAACHCRGEAVALPALVYWLVASARLHCAYETSHCNCRSLLLFDVIMNQLNTCMPDYSDNSSAVYTRTHMSSISVQSYLKGTSCWSGLAFLLMARLTKSWTSGCAFTGVKRSRRTDALKGFHKDDKDEAECAICHLYLHVSGLECDCCPGRRVCLHHADNLCECDPTRWRLVYRYSLEDLDRVLQQVCSHVPGEGRRSFLS